MKRRAKESESGIAKAPTGIAGLDDITGGGLPAGRATLVCGAAGCGKTMLALEFIVRGATHHGEPGVFIMFEETPEELAANARSIGFDLEALRRRGRVAVDHVRVERAEIQETGEYDLEALFIRIDHAVRSVGAKRVVLDTLEALFAGLPDEAVLRAELRRLLRWLKDRGLTVLVTGERGREALTRHGIEEYVADCVIVLDHRVHEQVSTRRLRVIKYRGSAHGTNEYPFTIGARGLSVLPITSLKLDHRVSARRATTGFTGLDAMFGGKGIYLGSSVLVSGSAGSGKTSIAASFAAAACARGERALMFAYEESPSQIRRNLRSIGLDLGAAIDAGLLRVESSRPTLFGLEQHLLQMHDLVQDFEPALVVVDPISNLTLDEDNHGVRAMLLRLIDFLKQLGVTGVYTHLAHGAGESMPSTFSGVSSLMDTWLLLENQARDGERKRTLQVLKSRGMAHSHRIQAFHIDRRGLHLSKEEAA